MNLRKSGYEIEVKRENVSRLEEKMLESGLCNFVVPIWISREGDKVKINYECSGLTSMRELHLKRPKETFEIIEKALLSLNHSRDFYIPPEKLKLSMDTIYYNRQNRSVKIAYVPERNILAFFSSLFKDFFSSFLEHSGRERSWRQAV